MGKRIIQLYADDESIQMAKARQINMSSLFRNILNAELYNDKSETKEQEILKLKATNAILCSTIEKLNKELEKMKKTQTSRDPQFERKTFDPSYQGAF